MPTAVPSDAENQPPPATERRVLARAVGVWWVQRLLEAVRRRRAGSPARDDDDELRESTPARR